MKRVHATSTLSKISCPTTLVFVKFVEGEVGGGESQGGEEAVCTEGGAKGACPGLLVALCLQSSESPSKAP